MESSIIVTAIVAGATLGLKDTASKLVKDAYSGLKSVLSKKFSLSSISTLEKDPADNSFKAALAKEIELTPELLEDKEVRALLLKLFHALEQDQHVGSLTTIGVDVETIKSHRDTIISDVSGFDEGVRAELIESGQDTKIEKISGKTQA